MPNNVLVTRRLHIRPFQANDLRAIHRILDVAFGNGDLAYDPQALEQRRSWLQWQMLEYEWRAKLHQPPYGDRAIVLADTGALIGAVGYVPCLDVFEQLPGLRGAAAATGHATTELGLFWAVDPAQQRRGYASEAAQAMIGHAFGALRLRRIIATTEYDNAASQALMRKLGMRLERNPLPTPPWLQVVGVLDNPAR